METEMFTIEGEYFLWCGAMPIGRDKWRGSVLFERKRDHGALRSPAMRHLTEETFDDPKDACRAALDHGYDCIERDDVGL